MAATNRVAAVAKLGDLAERHYLELKSSLDLSQKKDKEKIAKFILGAANRMPDIAQSAFEGVAVMIVGVAKGQVEGIPPVEMMDISKVVQKFLGADGPRWDVLWVPLEDSTNQVLVVLVDPPVVGRGPFPCRAHGDSLTDGRVYIRAEGETREASSDELDLLIQRGNIASRLDLDFSVEVLGQIAAVECDDTSTVEEYLTGKSTELLDALPKKKPKVVERAEPQRGIAGLGSIYSVTDWAADEALRVNSLLMEPEERTEEEYRAEIESWETQVRESWAGAKAKIAAGILQPATVRVKNNTSVFLHDVELRLHLEGDISGHDWVEVESILTPSALELPTPPRRWGPKERQPLGLAHDLSWASQMGNTSVLIPSSISYENGGSVHLTVDIGDLRPRGVFESEDKELVLLVNDKEMKTIHGTWEITARGHNEVFSGEINLPVEDSRDVTELAQFILEVGKKE